MKYLSPDFYEDFKCIGGECPATCCAGEWTIYIDQETKKQYDSVPGAFGQTLKENIITTNDSLFAFRLTENGRCPFLDSDNLCEIYQQLGPEKLCNTCQIYPRVIFQYGDITFHTLTLSCPEVSRIILNRTSPISFSLREMPSKNENDPSTDWDWFNKLMSCFIFSIDLIQNRNYPLSARLRVLLIFNFTLQTLLDDHKDISPLFEIYSNQDYLDEQLSSFSRLSSNFPAMYSAFLHFYQDIGVSMHHFIFPSSENFMETFINSYDEKERFLRITDSFHLLMDTTYDIQYEHLCALFLFRNYFNAYTTKKPFKEITQLIYALLIYRGYALPFCFGEKGISIKDQLFLFPSISRIFEQNGGNLKKLIAYYEKIGETEINFLLTLV